MSFDRVYLGEKEVLSFLQAVSPFSLIVFKNTFLLDEISIAQKEITLSLFFLQGDEMLNFLQGNYLPKHNLSSDQTKEFCEALKSDNKLFRNYMKVGLIL